MSKNVAVFVDVANIFYAAKAAGVDIDYVTLLKSATAGRDFVRAYAYTGLDPENENQRQFHQFLARSGYKVVSKDIRKYGDGKIKANLDIELVVDLMRTARNLDIAVIVSGDGDFAPAIRAVQQQGVRVEVISFRGNTSSDLIEVADVFTDIAQVARVERGSSRSGRRVAAEGDLSMTEVPDKETEGAPRRRRGGRGRTGDREVAAARGSREVPAAAAESGGMPGNLIVLPGEKLSRAPAGQAEDGSDTDVGESEGVIPVAADGDGGRRRRRRRGGRGRGRGRSDAPLVAAGPGLDEEDDGADFQTPRLPPASTFGSVWDSQLGVPTAVPIASDAGDAESGTDEEEFEDEPEIPEYLIAERRQRAARGRPGRPGQGGRGARAAYQSAVERERYGRGAGFGATSSYGAPRRDDRRDDRSRRGGRPQRDRGGRGGEDRQPVFRPAPGGDPWSEVPPELEELLRAQLAQKGTRPDAGERPLESGDPSIEPAQPVAAGADGEASAAEEAAAPTASRSRAGTRGAGARGTGARTTRSRSASAGATETADASAEPAEAASEPKRRTTRRKAADADAAEEAKPATRRRTTRSRAAAPADGEQTDGVTPEGGES